MESFDRQPEYEFDAAGPEGLEAVLDVILARSKEDADFAKEQHVILYTLGQQKALITVDTSKEPFHFHYEDLLGRPATKGVKETLARFLWEKCGEKDRYIQQDREGGQ